MQVFWAKGFSATSTEDLVEAMGIGRQSLYNAFGDKQQLYREALVAYQQNTMAGHLARLSGPTSPLAGIGNLLTGLVAGSDRERKMGCMGVGSVAEFGTTDPELCKLRAKAGAPLRARMIQRLREGQASGEIDPALDPEEATGFILMTMTGIQLAARGGAGAEDLRRMARFAANRLKAR